MVDEVTRNSVWNEYLDIERAVRYYGRLADKYRKYHQVTMFGLAVCVIVSTVNLLFIEKSSYYISMGANILVLTISVFSLRGNFAKKSANLFAIGALCSDLLKEHRTLWRKIESHQIENDEVGDILENLIERGNKATIVSGWADIGIDHHLNQIAYNDAKVNLASQHS